MPPATVAWRLWLLSSAAVGESWSGRPGGPQRTPRSPDGQIWKPYVNVRLSIVPARLRDCDLASTRLPSVVTSASAAYAPLPAGLLLGRLCGEISITSSFAPSNARSRGYTNDAATDVAKQRGTYSMDLLVLPWACCAAGAAVWFCLGYVYCCVLCAVCCHSQCNSLFST